MTRRVHSLLRPALLAACVGLAVAPAALAQQADTHQALPADPTNAALVYWRAWALEPADLGDKIKTLYDADKPVEPHGELATLLESPEARQTIRHLTAASRLPECDFGIEYSEGFMALIPHLSKVRASARLLAADAAVAQAQGRHTDAADRLATIYRMAAQITSERVLISSLVAQAVLGLGHTRVRLMHDAGHLTPDAARLLEADLARFGPDDPFGIRASLAAEGAVTCAWVERTFTGPDAGAKAAEMLVDAGTVADSPGVPALRAMNEDTLHASLAQVRRYYAECLDAYDPADPGCEARLAAIAERNVKGEFGPLAQVIAPSTTMILKADRKHRDALAEVRTLLAGVK